MNTFWIKQALARREDDEANFCCRKYCLAWLGFLALEVSRPRKRGCAGGREGGVQAKVEVVFPHWVFQQRIGTLNTQEIGGVSLLPVLQKKRENLYCSSRCLSVSADTCVVQDPMYNIYIYFKRRKKRNFRISHPGNWAPANSISSSRIPTFSPSCFSISPPLPPPIRHKHKYT